MSDATGPGAQGGDPLRRLRLPTTPLAPRPAFAGELRRRIEAALEPDPQPTVPSEAATPRSEPDRTESSGTSPTKEVHMSTDTTQDTTQDASAAGAHPPLSPYLAVPRAAEAIDWYREVLGAIETTRFVGDDGRVGHAELVIGGSRFMLADEFPEMGVHGPGHYGGTSVMLHLELADVDYTYQRAVDAGAEPQRPPADQGHGNRNATIVDPFGHRWMLSQAIAPGRAAAAEAESGAGGDGGAWQVSGRAPVEPGYLTINPGDPARAREFFGPLFGWEMHAGNIEGGAHVGNTKFPIGIAPPSVGSDAAGAPTTVYFRVDDPEHYARRVEELGGRVLVRNDYASGTSISCEDDQGYRFELWQPAPGY